MLTFDLSDIQSASREELIELVKNCFTEIERLHKRIEELERDRARPATPFSKGEPIPKSEKKKPGRKGRKNGDKGSFKHRQAPEIKPTDQVQRLKATLEPDIDKNPCPKCGKNTIEISTEEATTLDIVTTPPRLIKIFEVAVARCGCGHCERGTHPELQTNQHGATAHRLGPNIIATGLALTYHFGVTIRKVPAILKALCDIDITQSALTQQALKLGQKDGAIGNEAEQIREEITRSERVHTDDTGWKIGGVIAYLMAFGTTVAAYFQIRFQHRAKEVAEVITKAFEGVLITDRFSSYDSSLFDLVAQQKCLAHILKNLSELIKTKQGSAKVFASKLAELLRKMLDLWDRHRNGEISLEEYRKQGAILNKELDVQLRKRNLTDPNNDSMLNELGWHQDRGNLTRFLDDPAIDPTNNFAERLLRAAVIARKVSHCSKNERGANAYAAIKSVLTTLQLRGEPIIESLAGLIAGARSCSAR